MKGRLIAMRGLIFSLLIIFLVFYFNTGVFAANSVTNTFSMNIATVDTAPGASGYYTASINPKAIYKQHGEYAIFRVSGSADGDATVYLQYRGDGDSVWTDYGTTYNVGDWVRVEDISHGLLLRGIIKSGGLTAGTVIFGFYYK